MTLGYHSKDIAQGEKESNKKEKQGLKKQYSNLGQKAQSACKPSQSFETTTKETKYIINIIAQKAGRNKVFWSSQTPNKLKTII